MQQLSSAAATTTSCSSCNGSAPYCKFKPARNVPEAPKNKNLHFIVTPGFLKMWDKINSALFHSVSLRGSAQQTDPCLQMAETKQQFSLSLSLSLTHTHTHTHTKCNPLPPSAVHQLPRVSFIGTYLRSQRSSVKAILCTTALG